MCNFARGTGLVESRRVVYSPKYFIKVEQSLLKREREILMNIEIENVDIGHNNRRIIEIR